MSRARFQIARSGGERPSVLRDVDWPGELPIVGDFVRLSIPMRIGPNPSLPSSIRVRVLEREHVEEGPGRVLVVFSVRPE